MRPRTAVIGIGNLLLGDEGLGIHVINQLKKYKLPKNVEVYDCGTGGLGILEVLKNCDKAIVIDVVRGGGKPGTVYKLKLKEGKNGGKLEKIASLHQLDLATVMKIGKKISKMPSEVLLFGVEPKTIKLGLNLSQEVKKIVPKVVSMILKELNKVYSDARV